MSSSSAKSLIRPPAVAGTFYPSSSRELQRDVDEMLANVKAPRLTGQLIGLVAPHAGYMYSGFTAAHSYKMMNGIMPDAVIVVGPSHREAFDGVSIFPGDSYCTPLGEVPIHGSLRADLANESKNILLSPLGHGSEHS